jgi:hypothetical protein
LSDALRNAKRMEREARAMLALVVGVNAAHGADTWVEFDAEGAEIIGDSLGRLRAVLDDVECELRDRLGH